MNVLIIEDEAPAFRRLQKLIHEVDDAIEIVEVIDSVSEASKWLQAHQSPDLIFMDIHLADGISFEIFDQVEVTAPVIFTTAYDEYTLKAFKVNSVDYLLKPLKKEELAQSLQKFKQLKSSFGQDQSGKIEELLSSFNNQKQDHKSRFLVKVGDKLRSVMEDEAAYFYIDEGVVILRTNQNQKYALDYSLDELETMLDPKYFFRLNRQTIARFQAIAEIHSYFKGKLKVDLKPESSQENIISRERASAFKRWLDV